MFDTGKEGLSDKYISRGPSLAVILTDLYFPLIYISLSDSRRPFINPSRWTTLLANFIYRWLVFPGELYWLFSRYPHFPPKHFPITWIRSYDVVILLLCCSKLQGSDFYTPYRGTVTRFVTSASNGFCHSHAKPHSIWNCNQDGQSLKLQQELKLLIHDQDFQVDWFLGHTNNLEH